MSWSPPPTLYSNGRNKTHLVGRKFKFYINDKDFVIGHVQEFELLPQTFLIMLDNGTTRNLSQAELLKRLKTKGSLSSSSVSNKMNTRHDQTIKKKGASGGVKRRRDRNGDAKGCQQKEGASGGFSKRKKRERNSDVKGCQQKRLHSTPAPLLHDSSSIEILKSAANKSLDQAIELLGDSLQDSSSIEIWKTLQRSKLGWKCVKSDLKYLWFLLPGTSKMEGVLGINMFCSVENLVNTLKQRHEELCGKKSYKQDLEQMSSGGDSENNGETIEGIYLQMMKLQGSQQSKLIQDSGNDSSSSSSMKAAELVFDQAMAKAEAAEIADAQRRQMTKQLSQQSKLIQDSGDDSSSSSSMKAAELVFDQAMAKAEAAEIADARGNEQSDEELLKQQQAALQQHEIESEHVCSVCQEVMSCNSICVPALLVCGHVSTCVSCYEKWNTGKLVKLCPICKITQTISPIRVNLGYKRRYTDEPRFSLDVTYVTRVTQQKTPIIISCTLLSTGEEIKKSATVKILLDKTITYPEEFQTLTFRTENKSFNFHGNTTLYDIGFEKTSHTLYIIEDELPINHKFIQERLEKMECSPNTEYQIRLRAAKGLELSDISMTVQKDHTIASLMDRLTQYLMDNYFTSIAGKKILINFPDIGVLLQEKLTLEELKINTTSYIVFKIFD